MNEQMTPYIDGYQGRCNSIPKTSNPYKSFEKEPTYEWYTGWEDANDYLEFVDAKNNVLGVYDVKLV